MSFTSQFAREIHRARTQLGYSQLYVANGVSISTRWYQKLERGDQLPGAEVMMRLLLLLELDISLFREHLDMVVQYRYQAIEQHLYRPDIGHYTSYGIRAFQGTQGLETVSDVACSRSFATLLAARLTRLQIHPLQLCDVVLDALV